MDLDALTRLVAASLGKDVEAVTKPTETWDSLDRLEIITHLHDELGAKATDLDGLNSFTNLETLADALRADGLLV